MQGSDDIEAGLAEAARDSRVQNARGKFQGFGRFKAIETGGEIKACQKITDAVRHVRFHGTACLGVFASRDCKSCEINGIKGN